jgi:hypothetical protein
MCLSIKELEHSLAKATAEAAEKEAQSKQLVARVASLVDALQVPQKSPAKSARVLIKPFV